MKHKTFTDGDKIFSDSEMIIEHYITTSMKDRYGEVINQYGMDSDNYRKNPVVLLAHNSRSIVIGKNLSLTIDEKGIKAKTQFADTQLGRELYNLNKDGFMNAWSIGFIPKGEPERKMINGEEVIFIDKWELLEYSSVAIPANPESLNLIIKNFYNHNQKNERKKIMEELNNQNPETLDVQKVEAISKKIASEIVKKELNEAGNIFSTKIPQEVFKDSENRNSKIIQDGRNYLKSIVYGRPNLYPAEYRDFLNESTGSEGGNLVPQQMYHQIMSMVNSGGVAMRNATVYNMSRRELVIPKLDTLPTWNFVNEGAIKPVSNPSFAQVILRRQDGGFIVLFSKQLLEDEAFDVMGFVTNLASQILSFTIDSAAFRGYDPNIKGLLNNGIGAQVLEIGGTDFDSLAYTDIINAVSSVPSHTLPKAKWYMNKSIYGMIKSLKNTDGTFVLSPQDRKEMILEGYPIELSDACYSKSESEPDKAFIAFGDLSYMAIGLRNYLTIDFSKDASVLMGEQNVNLWQSGLVGLNFNASFDIKFTYPIALAVLKTQQ